MVCELDGPTPILKRSNALVTKDQPPAAHPEARAAAWQAAPFVLLDDARSGTAWLYREPRRIIETREPGAVRATLALLRDRDRHAAGFISWEAGYVLESKLAPLAAAPADDAPPLLWFGLFDAREAVESGAILPDPAGACARSPRPLISRADHEAMVERALALIVAGDIYQANITFPAEVDFTGDPLALYAAIRSRAAAGHGALAFTGAHWILSFSPESFFALAGGRIAVRPMKGTATRAVRAAEDKARAVALAADPKERAENLMIVDLMRNDVSRVSTPGTVKVPELFAVETYPTVHQMVSLVTAELVPGLGPVDVIEAIFPCGSVSGAPKIRAMEVIAELETAPRGVYCGAIGALAPGGEAAFNVAIRTLVIRAGESMARIGLGSGIVADSRPGDEWRECLAKGKFVETGRRFDLIETMRFDPSEGIALLDRHLARMKASAAALAFTFDRHHARNELQAATFRLRDRRRIRLLLSKSGRIAIESRPMAQPPAEPVRVAIAPLPVAAGDFRLAHKTSDRGFYDAARAAGGAFETLFEDADGFLTEGSITSLFVERDGILATPPLARGLLPGVLRASLIDEGKAVEADLRRDDLGGAFRIGNSVMGLLRATL